MPMMPTMAELVPPPVEPSMPAEVAQPQQEPPSIFHGETPPQTEEHVQEAAAAVEHPEPPQTGEFQAAGEHAETATHAEGAAHAEGVAHAENETRAEAVAQPHGEAEHVEQTPIIIEHVPLEAPPLDPVGAMAAAAAPHEEYTPPG